MSKWQEAAAAAITIILLGGAIVTMHWAPRGALANLITNAVQHTQP